MAKQKVVRAPEASTLPPWRDFPPPLPPLEAGPNVQFLRRLQTIQLIEHHVGLAEKRPLLVQLAKDIGRFLSKLPTDMYQRSEEEQLELFVAFLVDETQPPDLSPKTSAASERPPLASKLSASTSFARSSSLIARRARRQRPRRYKRRSGATYDTGFRPRQGPRL